ncbi:MAG: hypothetical protein DRH24_09880 [Deltaproteobacteria bacterium]|nr:MAG: hypothetical protein DRH24_09880 [Deltaproteobacteria bacterium]
MDEFTSVGDLPQQIAVKTAPTSKWHPITVTNSACGVQLKIKTKILLATNVELTVSFILNLSP